MEELSEWDVWNAELLADALDRVVLAASRTVFDDPLLETVRRDAERTCRSLKTRLEKLA